MPIVSIREEFQTFLDKEGLKLTRERQLILDNIFEAHEHFEADDLWARLRAKSHRVSKATIYRSLSLLVQSGIIRESIAPTGSSSTHYEMIWGQKDRHHDHMECQDCGDIVPFSNEVLYQVLKGICREEGFVLDDHILKLRAHCAELLKEGTCQRSGISREK